MSTLGLVDRHRHTENTDCPTGNNTSHQNHGQILCRTLQDSTNSGQCCTKLDCSSSAEPIDGQTGRESANGSYVSIVNSLCLRQKKKGNLGSLLTPSGESTVNCADNV